MSGPTSNPDWNRSGSPAYGTFPRPRLSSNQSRESYDSATAHSNSGEISPKRRPSPSRKPSRHIEFRKYLKRPHLTESQRTLSDALRAAKSREEQETLMPDDDHAGSDGCFNGVGEPVGPRDLFPPYPHADLQVYYNIHRIRRLILAVLEDPYTTEQLREPRMNVLIVKPLVDRLYDEEDISIVYCLLVNRMQFLREQQFQQHHRTVDLTRANLCELVAMKILRRHDEESTGKPGLLHLAHILVAPFQPFQGAPEERCPPRHVSEYQGQGDYEGKLTALEVAIVSESKVLLSSSASQKVIDAVYRGRIVYTPTTFIDIIPDHYKHKPISLYDPRKAPLLNQYRLMVPRTRNVIEVVQFIILLALYSWCMTVRKDHFLTNAEIVFILYGGGWVLDELISCLEHGWEVHTQELWAFLDVTFAGIFIIYFSMRVHGWLIGNDETGRQALDVLAVASPILFPRIAFNLMPENMLFIALRAMVKEFTALSLIAIWCFGGFLLALKWLSISNPEVGYEDSPNSITISKWMLWIWFGLDGQGIDEAPGFHEILGPILMVIYAFIGNTLFLTVLVSILSNTFSKIAADATAEIQFRRAVLTFEGVKSDSLFAYRPPFNLLAFVVLLPLKFLLSPRWFHKINITAVRVLNFPILVAIAYHERRALWRPSRRQSLSGPGPSKRSTWLFDSDFWGKWKRMSPHADLQAVFEDEPPSDVVQRIEEEDDLEDAILENSFAATAGADRRSISPGSAMTRRRRLSSAWPGPAS
ncbi:Nn.00g052120.m01.CDS01 [Neocucurbitaria sp. VM-36]